MTKAGLKVLKELKDMPMEKFEKELEDIKKGLDRINKKRSKPKALQTPNIEKLKKVCEEYINYMDSDDYHEDNDYGHFIYEEAITAIYGNNIWKWINSHA